MSPLLAPALVHLLLVVVKMDMVVLGEDRPALLGESTNFRRYYRAEVNPLLGRRVLKDALPRLASDWRPVELGDKLRVHAALLLLVLDLHTLSNMAQILVAALLVQEHLVESRERLRFHGLLAHVEPQLLGVRAVRRDVMDFDVRRPAPRQVAV